MSNKDEKFVEAEGTVEPVEEASTKDIKGTDFVEPQGKLRKAIKWVVGGVVVLVSGAVGCLIGRHMGNGGDDEDNSPSSEEPTTNE